MGTLPLETILRMFGVIVILPLMCGSFFAARLRYYERRGFFLNAYLFGWIAVFALFELICTPYVVTLRTFSSFCRVFDVSVIAAALISTAAAIVILCKRRKKADKQETEQMQVGRRETEQMQAGRRETEQMPADGQVAEQAPADGQVAGRTQPDVPDADAQPKDRTAWWAWILWGIVIASVLAQMVFFYFNNHMNGDDSYYIAQSVITDLIDTMYQRDAYTGTPMGLDVRHALSVLPIFVTWIGRVCGVHAATAAHAVLGPVFLAVCYGVYVLLGRALFRGKRSMVPLFVLLVQIWYLWGNISIYTPETFLYTRTWQGKAVFANIILPVAFYLLYRLFTEWKNIYVALLFLLSIAGIFTTTASVYLLSMLYGIAALYCLITRRQWKKFLRVAVCAVPAFAYGLIYIWLLRTW